ncbi:hypothetical protein [Halalkalibacter urbisdiaboli]|uniref:hypothetical protein n=1 Tax=Halalkalibacter urbisdiaboli TaxID=1960589 RepID=UPI000B43E599|nr:hypothetical protein [Halalkalibacter urbisdiaboli]
MNKKTLSLFSVFFLIISIFSITVFANLDTEKKDIKWVKGSLPDTTLDELVEEADIIAKVKITELKSVIEEPDGFMSATVFGGKVKKYYENNTANEDDITLFQAGSPEWQFYENPLLEVGKTYILFLKEHDVPGEGKALAMVSEGYGRYLVENNKVKAHLKPKQSIFKEENLVDLGSFEEDFKKKIKEKHKANN